MARLYRAPVRKAVAVSGAVSVLPVCWFVGVTGRRWSGIDDRSGGDAVSVPSGSRASLAIVIGQAEVTGPVAGEGTRCDCGPAPGTLGQSRSRDWAPGRGRAEGCRRRSDSRRSSWAWGTSWSCRSGSADRRRLERRSNSSRIPRSRYTNVSERCWKYTSSQFLGDKITWLSAFNYIKFSIHIYLDLLQLRYHTDAIWMLDAVHV